MKKLLILPLAAALFSACTDIKPVEVVVPNDPSVLHGRYVGIMQEVGSGGVGPELAAQLSSTATYVSQTVYKASGTLSVEGKTYTFTGQGRGSTGTTFTAQWSPPYAVINFDADLFLNGEKIGILTEDHAVSPSTRQYLTVQVGSKGYSLNIDRE